MLLPGEGPFCFSLDPDDSRIFFHDPEGHIDRLTGNFVDWMDRFVGKWTHADGHSVGGDSWHYEEISTTGFTDYSLTFEDGKHAAMFKLIWGYDLV
jgi:hypothetical protein